MDHISGIYSDPGQGGFLSREELARQNARLREELRLQREDNLLLVSLLAQFYEQMPAPGGAAQPAFPLSDAAIDLFEELAEAFTLEDAFHAAERLGQGLEQAAAHVRTYLDEEMILGRPGQGSFVKTGRKPYF